MEVLELVDSHVYAEGLEAVFFWFLLSNDCNNVMRMIFQATSEHCFNRWKIDNKTRHL